MRYFISLLLIPLIISCQHQPKKDSFLQQISDFDKRIIKHFPKKLEGMYITSVINDRDKNVISISLLNDYKPINKYDILLNDSKKKLFFKINDSLVALSKAKYNPKDSCLLVVNMYTNENNFFNSFKTKNQSYLKKECLKNKFPIPNFWSLDLESDNITKLPDDFDIFVFESKHKILDDKYLSKNVFMPEFWKHGYSKGVAINDKTYQVIYWFVLW